MPSRHGWSPSFNMFHSSIMRNILTTCRCQLHLKSYSKHILDVQCGSNVRLSACARFRRKYSYSRHSNMPFHEQGNYIHQISGMDNSKRLMHLVSSLQAQVIPAHLPVTINEAKIRSVLKSYKVPFEVGYTCLILECIFCKHKKSGRKPDGEKMYVNLITGSFTCQQCGCSGCWAQLEDHLSLMQAPRARRACQPQPQPPQPPPPAVTRAWEAAQSADQVDADCLEQALERLDLKDISVDTLRRFEARLTADGGLLVPLCRPDGSLAGVRQLTPRTDRTLPAGLHVPAGPCGARGREHAVLTARLADALAVAEKCRLPVLALPHGNTSLPPDLLPLLERFNKLTLWFPGDVVSWNSVRAFARKLGEKRCFTVRPSTEHGSPLDALRAGVALPRVLDAAAPLYHSAITTFSTLRRDVFEELSNATQVAGVQWTRFPTLNRLLRGHRRGELTVMSGPTGAGKTTFMSEYSLDLCMQGVNTLWGSFEINNTRLAKVMLQQMANCALDRHLDKFDQAADEFEKLSMWFMTFHGQQSITNVLDAMSHSAYVHDIGHVVLDNLQFMMGVGERTTDRFFEQDAVISRFRRFATMKNCHVTLVVHPRKERDDDQLGLASVFGGARATQEADNVLMIQILRSGDTQRKYVQVLKNRFSGDLGSMPLSFNRDSLSFVTRRNPRDSPTKLAPAATKGTPDSPA